MLELGDTPVFDCLLELSDHHLILPVENARIDIPRFRMLTIVAESARNRLIEHGEELDARQAFASAITRYAEQRKLSGLRPHLEYQIGELNENFHNITTALSWLHRRGDGLAALRLVGALSWFWYAHGYYRDGQQWFERVLALDIPRNGADWARFLTGYGILLDVQGQFGKAHAVLREAYEHHEGASERTGMAAASIALGYCSFHLQRFDEADRHLHRAIELARGISSPDLAQSVEGLAWENLGANAHERDALPEAEDALRRAIAIHHRAGYRWGEARAMVDLGGVLRDLQRPQESLAAYRFVLDPALQIGDLRLIAVSLAGLATLLASDEQGISSAWFWGALDALRPITGYPSFLRANLRAWDRARNVARESVRASAYETAYHAGANAPVAEALAIAQEVTLRGSSMHTVPPDLEEELTSRERDVLELLVQGASTRAIAATLGITERTVSSHLGSLFRKFGVNSRLELIAVTAHSQ
jgi:DNA-binding CsgD family transcriptional regulator/tetratricopeptide (TPR) repeat protein